MVSRPRWAFSGHYLVNFLLDLDNLSVICLEGVDHHFDIICEIPANSLVLALIPADHTEFNFKLAADCVRQENPWLDLNRILWLCNHPDQVTWAKKYGFDAIFCHQNAFINEETFCITGDHSDWRPFDLVLNTRPEKIKRPWLARGVERLAIIKGNLYNKNDYYDLTQLSPIYMNESRIGPEEVTAIYNKSIAGGIFRRRRVAVFRLESIY